MMREIPSRQSSHINVLYPSVEIETQERSFLNYHLLEIISYLVGASEPAAFGIGALSP